MQRLRSRFVPSWCLGFQGLRSQDRAEGLDDLIGARGLVNDRHIGEALFNLISGISRVNDERDLQLVQTIAKSGSISFAEMEVDHGR